MNLRFWEFFLFAFWFWLLLFPHLKMMPWYALYNLEGPVDVGNVHPRWGVRWGG